MTVHEKLDLLLNKFSDLLRVQYGEIQDAYIAPGATYTDYVEFPVPFDEIPTVITNGNNYVSGLGNQTPNVTISEISVYGFRFTIAKFSNTSTGNLDLYWKAYISD